MNINIDSIKRNLIDRYPFFGSIIDSLDYIETENCVSYNRSPTAGTNGNTIYYHPIFIENLTESQQTFVFAHEVCHGAFNHLNKDKDQEVWNNKLLKKKQRKEQKNKNQNKQSNSNCTDTGHDTHSLWNEKILIKEKMK